MRNLRDLSRRMSNLAADYDDRANAVKVAAATAIVVDLVRQTPVDTSQALSNWVVSLDTPNRSVIAPRVPGIGGSSRAASIEATIRAALAILSTARPRQTIFISNCLPYIRKLNDGHSAQAPAGFVERSMLIGSYTVKRVRF